MPQRYQIRILPEASADIASIFRYIEYDSLQNAVSVADAMIRAIDSLAFLPRRYEVHRSSRSRDRIVRSMPVPPFIVYYRILETQEVVEIMTCRHGARRQPTRFR